MDDAHGGPDARAPEPEDLARICRALNEAGALYVLIGGYAIIAHGFGRTTQDIDLLVEDSPENVVRVKKALGILADNAASQIGDGDVRQYQVVRVADEIVVDLIGRAGDLRYEDAVGDSVSMTLAGVSVPVASKQTLLRTKQGVRAKDVLDRQYLEQRIAEEEGSDPEPDPR